ncbi:MAG TPA: phenylalanine--tRNA ligase subunit beta [Bryobacteraceae bacterium]|jgi:phenylalanyl-tRNA synthetase beta chain
MKFSYQWLSDLVDGLGGGDPRELMRLITMKTAECEGIEEAGSLLRDACAAHVISAVPIAGSHNQTAVVETALYGKKTVVCGAPNCRAGLWTVYVPFGKKTIAGVESDGMLASEQELGLSRDHAGIVELDGSTFAFKPDSVIEVDNKSLTHRPDLWGHFGMAREVAAILGMKLIDPVRAKLPEGRGLYTAAIEDFELCPRYSALLFENVTVKPSPLWLQYRLEAIGLNPINNIVDVTNYVMSELSQPMHAFDADKLRGSTIFVRAARAGERIVALNKEEYELDSSNMVIADSESAIAIAGVIGGDASAIGASTTRMLLESACFNATSVRKTAAKIKNRTDASMRFEKSQDPETTVRGLARALELLEEVSPGIRLAGGLTDSYQPLPGVAPIRLPLDWLDRKLGVHVAAEKVRAILEALGFAVDSDFVVTVPSWRATKDVSCKEDLAEEVGRMIGYGEITPTAPRVASSVPPATPERDFQHRLRDLMTDQGFTEVYNYSFLSEEAVKEFGLDPESHVRVLNPIASDQSLMRTSLLPGILSNLRENRKHSEAFRLFEIGHEIHKQVEGLPDEMPHVVCAIFSKDGDGAEGLFELKRVAECMLPSVATRPVEARGHEHPARACDIVRGHTIVGRLFEFHPKMLEGGRGAVLDVDIATLRKLGVHDVVYKPIRKYPATAFDLSVIVEERHLVGDIESALDEIGGAELLSIEFLRLYSGPPMAAGQKSVSFRLTSGAGDRTLTTDEVTAFRNRVIESMQARGYELRV